MELNNFKEKVNKFKKDVNVYINSLEKVANEINKEQCKKPNKPPNKQPNKPSPKRTPNERTYEEYEFKRGKRSYHNIVYDNKAAGEKTPFKITDDVKWKNTLRKWYKQ